MSTVAAWFFYCTLVGVLLGLAALAGEEAARSSGRPGRLIWFAAMLTEMFALTPAISSSYGTIFPPLATFATALRTNSTASLRFFAVAGRMIGRCAILDVPNSSAAEY